MDYVNEEVDGAMKDEFRFKLNIAMGQVGNEMHPCLPARSLSCSITTQLLIKSLE
jgi:hypothetical protein